MVLNFDGLLVNNDFGELDEILPAYGVTTHKSQGSEYPAVVIPLSTQHTIRCYGAISSTREFAGQAAGGCWVGQRKALAIAVRDARAERR